MNEVSGSKRRIEMAEGIGKERKKEAMKDIIMELHQGLPVKEAKRRFEKEIGEDPGGFTGYHRY